MNGELFSQNPALKQKLLGVVRRRVIDHPFIVQPDEEGRISQDALLQGHPQGTPVLELGAGSGEFLASYAAEHSGDIYAAFEIKWDRIRMILKHIERRGLKNVRIVPVDFTWLLESMLPAYFFGKVIVLFPDPWPKKRHWKHRLVQPGFPDRIKKLMKPGAQIILATDYTPYARRMLAAFRRPDFTPVLEYPHFTRQNILGISTRFETMMQENGPAFMAFRQNDRAT